MAERSPLGNSWRQTLKILAGRMAAVALAAVLGALEESGVPHDAKGALAVAGMALGAVVAASPNLFAAAGILRPFSPLQASLYQKMMNAAQALLAAPAASRKQRVKDDLRAALRDPETLQVVLANPATRELLRAQLWQPGQPAPEPPLDRISLDLDPNRFGPAQSLTSVGTDSDTWTPDGQALPTPTVVGAAATPGPATALTGGNP